MHSCVCLGPQRHWGSGFQSIRGHWLVSRRHTQEQCTLVYAWVHNSIGVVGFRAYVGNGRCHNRLAVVDALTSGHWDGGFQSKWALVGIITDQQWLIL
eukprot:418601-Pelagomonas_calceolata.AAC.10